MQKYIEGKLTFVEGKGVLIVEDGSTIPLAEGILIQVMDELYGWTDGFFQNGKGFLHSRGTDELQPGDRIRMKKEAFIS
ncbi:hypothetical protein [Aneurinibacillus tyrosinisolvens]|uniref:hypothetical protein n=1 Tax=Aneurinibacillus tyrosinisolvens TaxID=1443435 RepID=UPI00063F7604|nr:hypothetical protein [Aneurinibacillus tyrosinisolvens]